MTRDRFRAGAVAVLLLAVLPAAGALQGPAGVFAQDRAPVRYGIVADGSEVRRDVQVPCVPCARAGDVEMVGRLPIAVSFQVGDLDEHAGRR